MRTAPAFWWRERPDFAATLLRPAGALYGVITAKRMMQDGVTLPVPALCVGNLVAGGAGKTPTAIAIAQLLTGLGHRPAFLSRGYGRAISSAGGRAVLRVDLAHHDVGNAGDEPLLLAGVAPTYVSTDRVAAARRATDDGATILVLDDGLQNPALTKSFSVAVVDGVTGIGNGLCIPAGPLRAPLHAQLPLVSAFCIVGPGEAGRRLAATAEREGLPVLRARLTPDAGVIEQLRGSPLYAFAGIGRPSKFFATLAEKDLDVRGRRALPDHHRFTPDDLAALLHEAEQSGARLVTTAKDRTRLPADFPAIALPVSLTFDDEARMIALLARFPAV